MWNGTKYESKNLMAELVLWNKKYHLAFASKLEIGTIYLQSKTEEEALSEAKEKLKQRFEIQ